MGVDLKNDVFGRILHLFVMPLHKWYDVKNQGSWKCPIKFGIAVSDCEYEQSEAIM